MRYNITQPVLNVYWRNNDHENRMNATRITNRVLVYLYVCISLDKYAVDSWVVVRPKRKYIHSLILPHSPFVGSFAFTIKMWMYRGPFTHICVTCSFALCLREKTLRQCKYTSRKWAPPPGHRLFISVYLLMAFIFSMSVFVWCRMGVCAISFPSIRSM